MIVGRSTVLLLGEKRVHVLLLGCRSFEFDHHILEPHAAVNRAVVELWHRFGMRGTANGCEFEVVD